MNTLIPYALPDWIPILFCMAIPIPILLISLVAYQTSSRMKNHSLFYTVSLFLISYIGYIFLGGYLGLYNQVTFPPRVLWFTTIPYAFFLFLVVPRLPLFEDSIRQTPLTSLVQVHIFRVIGSFFILLALFESLPRGFAFIAGCGDVITAVSSLFVAHAIRQGKSYARRLTYIWNTFGLVDILFTAIAANVLTKISIDTGSMGVDTLGQFPFFFIPAFAPPTIIFLHWIIFKKLKKIST